VIALTGPLGAGKTQLVKGIALGNGLKDARQVTSPTYVLVNEYAGRLHLYHLDVYRLAGVQECLTNLGFEEMVREDAAVVIEWADLVVESIPAEALWIHLQVGVSPLLRSVVFSTNAEKSKAMLEAVRAGDWRLETRD